MLIKQDGNLRTWHYLYTHIHALYILHICTCTFMLDVSKRGVLDRRMTILLFFLHIMTRFIGHGKICLQITSNSAYICNTWKTRDGRKFVKNFGVLGVSGLNK